MKQKTHLQTCTETFTIQRDEQKYLALKMDFNVFIFVSAILITSEGFTLKGSSGPLVVPLGGSVVLPCSVDSLLPLKDLEVEWRRSDTQTLIHLYQDEDIRPETQHQDYHDRAHFFTEDIKHGNFSLLLNNLTAEDEGQYTCKVHTGQESGETVVEIKHVERLIVSGSSQSISASVGEDVTLSCSVNSHIKPEEIKKVLWKKRDKDGDISVLLYQNNETQKLESDASDERYRDRVDFFTDEIHRGNFSLRLKRVRTEDKGVYICEVFTGRLSANTTVKLERLGFIVKGSYRFPYGGSAVLPCFIHPILITKDQKVEWSKSGLESPVCVYEDGEIRPEAQHHFFTEDIKHGNFSLLLKNLTKEDLGQYTCKVYTVQRSVLTVNVNLEDLVNDYEVDYSCDLVIPPKGSVILPCLNNNLPVEGLKVKWSKSGLKSPVCAYPDEDIRPESQHQDYHNRAHFFTEDIKHGDFSLLLNNLTAKDEGQYTCKVYSEERTSRSGSGSRSDSGSDSGTDEFTVSTMLVPRLLATPPPLPIR
ncbi:junctional adhesion molecule-like [Misgurnus anguillicaudatus]|uniref:junctional adhesion molecule-like n=1 Tax=Misgurnus anguillicaudatus TaxID=75329 RepID=UPI003CCFCE65